LFRRRAADIWPACGLHTHNLWQSHADANVDTDGNCYSYSYSYSNCDCDPNQHARTYAEGYSITKTSSDTTAPTVRLVDRRSVIVSYFGNSRANLASSRFYSAGCSLRLISCALLEEIS